MKTVKWLFLFLIILVPSMAFAVDAQELLPPETIVAILSALEKLPYVGPGLVFALKMVAIIAPIMTALSFAAQAILAIPELVARYKGAPALAEKIKAWSDKIVYWLSFLSARNAKKPGENE
jgi:hypothetical protein